MQSICVVILVLAAGVLAQDFPNQIRDPCTGRPSGVARDLTSCRHYFWCVNGRGSRGVCDAGRLFNGETELCVTADQRPCFACRSEPYHLNSVPNTCHQYIQCFNTQPTLHVCPSGLVYDGRASVRNCNLPPPTGGCYRENDTPEDVPIQCPPVGNRPVYLRHPNSCSM